MAGARDYNPPPPFFSSPSPFNHQIHPARKQAETKRWLNAEWKWMNHPTEAKQRSDAEANSSGFAVVNFKKAFPSR